MRRMPTVEEIIDLIKQYSEPLFEVSDIKSLTDAECNSLKVGNSIAKKTGNQRHNYIVTYKENNQGLCLSYYDASVVETVSYDYTEGHWVYNSTDVTELGGSGLPEVTSADNGKVLEVISGAWGKGNNKVNVFIPSELSALSSNEKREILSGGAFINGQFLGFDNPIFEPFNKNEIWAGFVIHGKLSGQGIYSFKRGQFPPNQDPEIVDEIYSFSFSGGKSFKIGGKLSPYVDYSLSSLGTITSTEIVSGALYKNEIAYTGEIASEDVVYVKMSNGAIYPMINDTANSKLFIYNGVDFQTGSITVSKCWKISY